MTFTKNVEHFVELVEGRRYVAYQDSAEVWTIGVGHTRGVKAGMRLTDSKIDELLKKDLTEALERVNKVVYKPTTQGELDALVSQAFNLRSFEKLAFHFNVDKEIWKSKTRLYTNDIKGNPLKGLKIRRIAEILIAEDREWKDFVVWAQKRSTTVKMIIEKEKELFSKPQINIKNEIAEADKLAVPKGLENIK